MTAALRPEQILAVIAVVGLCCGVALVARGAGRVRGGTLGWLQIASLALVGVSLGTLVTVLLSW